MSHTETIIQVKDCCDCLSPQNGHTSQNGAASVEAVVQPSLHLLLNNLGGHADFAQYRTFFRSLYCDPKRPITDVLGRRVVFDTYPTLDDCAHVCYGGTAGHAYKEEHWVQERAERIAWIEQAILHPNKVHPDEKIKTNEKYLLRVPPDGTNKEAEFYVVIVRQYRPAKTVAFLTAYPITLEQFEAFGKVGPRIFPEAKPKKKRR